LNLRYLLKPVLWHTNKISFTSFTRVSFDVNKSHDGKNTYAFGAIPFYMCMLDKYKVSFIDKYWENLDEKVKTLFSA